MLTRQPYSIHSVGLSSFDEFLTYLEDHLSDNGDPVYFQPMSREHGKPPAAMAKAFRDALLLPVGDPGWRRAWVLRDASRRIAGHVDVRALPERAAAHRCTLGMGVHRAHRQQGLGRRLIGHVEGWLAENTQVAWLDLQVLSENAPALGLYRAVGFEATGEIPDMFRIDGRSFAYTAMTKRLQR